MDSNNDPIDKEEKKIYYILGHDIRTITCFRSTMITTFSAGLGVTLASFLFTSDGFKSSRLGLLTMATIMTPMWLICARKELADAEALQSLEKSFKERTNEEYTIMDSLESVRSDSYG